ncbi:MAG: hypothetical protein HYU79_07685 [Nitrosomonadales bacterium]|nr:hypothetical protein [Nitrosomonadales bacterium]
MSFKAERNVIITASGIKALRTKLLKQAEHFVLWHLVASLPVTGDVVSHAELGRELAIAPSHISTAIKRLRELGFLTRGVKVGASYHYKLNPAFFRIIS